MESWMMSVAVRPAPSRTLTDFAATTRGRFALARPESHIRSLFISDLHLGFRHSQAEALLQFLHGQQPDYLYLIGDFIDGWCVGRRWSWPPACSDVVGRIIELSRNGTLVRLAIGNHDALLRHPLIRHLMLETGLCEVAEEYQHELADGRRFLILHGDRFDSCERLQLVWANNTKPPHTSHTIAACRNDFTGSAQVGMNS
jgi:UDP-2,3-diacylglucosamine pyrophosphatase LpxH